MLHIMMLGADIIIAWFTKLKEHVYVALSKQVALSLWVVAMLPQVWTMGSLSWQTSCFVANKLLCCKQVALLQTSYFVVNKLLCCRQVALSLWVVTMLPQVCGHYRGVSAHLINHMI